MKCKKDRYTLNDHPRKDLQCFSSFLTNLSPNEFVLLGMAVGYYISQGLTVNEQSSIGNLFELVGQILLTFNGQAVTVNSINNPYIRANDIPDVISKILKELKDNLP